MYVVKADYKGRITTTLLDMLINEDVTAIIAAASKTAEDTIFSLAGMFYDIREEFNHGGSLRNGFLLSMAISIGLYNIYQIADEESIPEKVIKNYDDTMNDLVKISQGKMTLNLPPAPTNGTEGTPGEGETVSTSGIGLRRIGSAPKRTHRV